MDHTNPFLRKRTTPPSGLGLGAMPSNKKPHFGMDFSALPTHLPGTSGPFASTDPPPSTNFSGSASLPPKPVFFKESKSETNTENRPFLDSSLFSTSANTSSSINENSTLETAQVNDTKLEKNESKPEKEPVFIEGTNITLQTEEDIAKWIAERRKKWPTRKNVEAKLQAQPSPAPTPAPEPVVENEQNTGPKQNVCKFYAKHNRCKFGNKCRNVHETQPKTCSNTNNNNKNNSLTSGGSGTRKIINGMLVNIPQRYKKEVNGAGSLFTKLVQRDLYEHENNIIVDFLQHLDSKGLINHDISAS